jgi:hypothetical protein
MKKHNLLTGKIGLNLTIILIGLLMLFSCKKDEETDSNVTNNIHYVSYSVDSVNFVNDTIYYDINGDNHFEIKLTKSFNIVENTMHYGGEIYGTDGDMMICYLKTEPTMDFIRLNDPISNFSSYNWMDKVAYNGGIGYIEGSNAWAQGAFTDYFGFKITLNNSLYYGWFHLKYFEISELGFNMTPNATIHVGQKL